LAATAARLLTGVPPWPLQEAHLLQRDTRAGPRPELVAALRQAAPTLAGPLLAALAAEPLGRAGALAALRGAMAEVLGAAGMAQVSIVRGGGPWSMGSPIVALAAWAGSGGYVDRFAGRTGPSATARRPSATDERVGAPPPAGEVADATDAPLRQARLDAALRALELQQAGTRQRPGRDRPRWVDGLVLLVTAAIAALVLWLGAQQREQARRGSAPPQPAATAEPGRRPRPRTLMQWPPRDGAGPAEPPRPKPRRRRDQP
jgi:hypothetical protein